MTENFRGYIVINGNDIPETYPTRYTVLWEGQDREERRTIKVHKLDFAMKTLLKVVGGIKNV